MYKYKFPIGDWSKDGHEKCEWFLVHGLKPVEEVREAHYEAEKLLGFSIGDICGQYEENYITKEYLEKLNELRIYLPEIDVEEYSKRFCPNAEELLHI